MLATTMYTYSRRRSFRGPITAVARMKLLLTLLLASEQVNAFSLGGVHQTRARALARQAAPLAQDGSMPAAYIEFIIGVPEPCIPDVKLTRSRDGSTGVATFTFDNPSFLAAASAELGETTGARVASLACATPVPAALREPSRPLVCAGMYLKDDEGTLSTTEVRRRQLPSGSRYIDQVAAAAPTPRTPYATPAHVRLR